MSRLKDISQAEFEVMEVLWHRGLATVKQVQADLGPTRRLAYTTIATLLNRLRDKGYVEAKEKGFAYEFRPLVEREEAIRRKLDDLVHRVLGGDIAPLAAYIAGSSNLTLEQVAALEDIVKSDSGKEDEDGGQ